MLIGSVRGYTLAGKSINKGMMGTQGNLTLRGEFLVNYCRSAETMFYGRLQSYKIPYFIFF